MATLFALLFLAASACLIIGLAKPNLFSKLLRQEHVTRKRIGAVFGGLMLLLFLFVAATVPETTTEEVAVNQLEEQATSTPAATPEQPPAPAEAPKPATIDQLWSALDRSIKNRKGIDLHYDSAAKVADLEYASDGDWDNNAIVSNAYSMLVKYGTEAFQISEVEVVSVHYKVEFTDQYGKKGMENAVILAIDKEEFQKFEWKNLNYQPVRSQMEAACTTHYIHPAILKDIRNDKLRLSI